MGRPATRGVACIGAALLSAELVGSALVSPALVIAALVSAALVSAALPAPAAAQDLAAGRRKAVTCQACHGVDGLSKLPEAPHLAGQPAIYLERSIKAYRSGERRHEVMTVMARTLSDDDIRDVSAFYAAIVIEVKELPGGKP